MGFPRQEYWSGVPFPSLGGLPNPGVEPASPALQADSLLLSHRRKPPLFPLNCPKLAIPLSSPMTKPRVLHPLPAAGATETDAERGRHREPPQASQAEESESIFIICQVEIKYSWGFLLGTQRTPDLQKTRGDLHGPQQMDMTRSSALDKSLQWLP